MTPFLQRVLVWSAMGIVMTVVLTIAKSRSGPNTSTVETRTNAQPVSEATFKDYPFTVAGDLMCAEQMIFLKVGKEEIIYPINGTAQAKLKGQADVKPLEEIWKDNPGGGKMSVGEILSEGQSLCL